MMGVVSGSLYRRIHSLSRLAWSWFGGRFGAVLHSSNEPGELSQWLCHDDSTINIVLDIILLLLLLLLLLMASHGHRSLLCYRDCTHVDIIRAILGHSMYAL